TISTARQNNRIRTGHFFTDRVTTIDAYAYSRGVKLGTEAKQAQEEYESGQPMQPGKPRMREHTIRFLVFGLYLVVNR
ncbi:MAG: hypothetical protein ACPGJE_06280, partial [Wenzhouxiangellaceae bacterium]